MHADQADVTAEAVARLVADQFPEWSGLPVLPVVSHGTENALFRLGDDVVLRLPLRPSVDAAARDSLLRERDLSRMVGRHTSLQVPEPLAIGEPGVGFAGWWAAYRWIDGEPVDGERAADVPDLAADLAQFVRDLHGIDPAGGWEGRGRGGPLTTQDNGVRAALGQSGDLVDTSAVGKAWDNCLSAADHPRRDTWIHADLMPGNLLIAGGRLAAVIDLGGVRIGDPAVDLMPAWNLMTADQRGTYRAALDVDDATWERGRGWAIAQAIIALPYYVDSNPEMARTARRTLAAILE